MPAQKTAFLSYLLILFFAINLFAADATWKVPFYEGDLEISLGKVAVVLGAGPAGLIAANAVLKSGKHDQVIILEDRPTFNRFNLVNYFPESVPMLRGLGIAQLFEKTAITLDTFRFYQEEPGKSPQSFSLNRGPSPTSFDYRGEVAEIFRQPTVGLDIMNLAKLQHELASAITRNPKIKLIEARANIVDKLDNQGLHRIEILHWGSGRKANKTYTFTPDLIIIAEGAHSKNREGLGIKTTAILKTQNWCSGSVSLTGVWNPQDKFMQVIDTISNLTQCTIRTFGLFNAYPNELFLNGHALEGEEVDACLTRNALALLKRANHDKGIVDPELRLNKIIVVRKSQGIVEISASKANKFYSGKNVIIIGDAAGNGSPKGGIGLSLVTSVYAQALLDLLTQWDSLERATMLESYNTRVSEIVDYWHNKMAADGVL